MRTLIYPKAIFFSTLRLLFTRNFVCLDDLHLFRWPKIYVQMKMKKLLQHVIGTRGESPSVFLCGSAFHSDMTALFSYALCKMYTQI